MEHGLSYRYVLVIHTRSFYECADAFTLKRETSITSSSALLNLAYAPKNWRGYCACRCDFHGQSVHGLPHDEC